MFSNIRSSDSRKPTLLHPPHTMPTCHLPLLDGPSHRLYKRGAFGEVAAFAPQGTNQAGSVFYSAKTEGGRQRPVIT